MSRTAKISQTQLTTARVDFSKDDFDILIGQKGLVFRHEIAIKCSCNREVSGQPLPHCVDCGGVGVIFIEPELLKGVVQAVNYDPKNMNYSEINLGTAQLTTRYNQRLGWMDRITLCDGETIFMENVFPELREVDTVEELSALLTYVPKSLSKVYMFVAENTPQLELIEGTDYTVAEGSRKLVLSDAIKTSFKSSDEKKKYIGIRYLHEPQYIIMDIQKDIRNTRVVDSAGKENLKNLPINCIIKKVHYTLNDNGFGSNAKLL